MKKMNNPLEKLDAEQKARKQVLEQRFDRYVVLLEKYFTKINRERLAAGEKILWRQSDMLDTEIEEYIKYASRSSTPSRDFCIFENYDNEERIYLEMPTGKVEKRNSFNRHVLFTKEELRYLDSVGFQLTADYTKTTRQRVEDWIYGDDSESI